MPRGGARNTNAWTEAEDAALVCLLRQGLQFKQLPPHLPGRSYHSAKARAHRLGLSKGRARQDFKQIRVTLYLTEEQHAWLQRRAPMSVYLRNLITKEMSPCPQSE